MKPFPLISHHAIERYRDRVDATATVREAAGVISVIVATAASRSRPRHWMQVATTLPGTTYLYSAAYPHIGLVVADGVVVTLHSRKVCQSWARLALVEGGRIGRRSHAYKRPTRRVELEEAA